MNAEGWYLDPFGLHEARWISDGSPTALVRDGTNESHDDPPSTTFEGPLEPVPEADSGNADTRRTDDDRDPDFRPEGFNLPMGLGGFNS